jgi:hypothetical protein
MKSIAGKEAPKSWQQREDAIARELINGNFPDFLLHWEAVDVDDGAGLKGRVWVMPDYLSIGNDQDWVYIPMSAPTAQRVADALKCVLPTPVSHRSTQRAPSSCRAPNATTGSKATDARSAGRP